MNQMRLTSWQRALLGHVMLAANARGYFAVQILYIQAEAHLQKMYPCNRNVRANIRDELQNLRDKGLLQNLDDGVWRVVSEMPCCLESTLCRPIRPRRKQHR